MRPPPVFLFVCGGLVKAEGGSFSFAQRLVAAETEDEARGLFAIAVAKDMPGQFLLGAITLTPIGERLMLQTLQANGYPVDTDMRPMERSASEGNGD